MERYRRLVVSPPVVEGTVARWFMSVPNWPPASPVANQRSCCLDVSPACAAPGYGLRVLTSLLSPAAGEGCSSQRDPAGQTTRDHERHDTGFLTRPDWRTTRWTGLPPNWGSNSAEGNVQDLFDTMLKKLQRDKDKAFVSSWSFGE